MEKKQKQMEILYEINTAKNKRPQTDRSRGIKQDERHHRGFRESLCEASPVSEVSSRDETDKGARCGEYEAGGRKGDDCGVQADIQGETF
jgi:hypothetical protein